MTAYIIYGHGQGNQDKDDILAAIRRTPDDGTCLKLSGFSSDWSHDDLIDFFQAIPEHISTLDLSASATSHRKLHKATHRIPATIRRITFAKRQILYTEIDKLVKIGKSLRHVIQITVLDEDNHYQLINSFTADIVRFHMGHAIIDAYKDLSQEIHSDNQRALMGDPALITLCYLLNDENLSAEEVGNFIAYRMTVEDRLPFLEKLAILCIANLFLALVALTVTYAMLTLMSILIGVWAASVAIYWFPQFEESWSKGFLYHSLTMLTSLLIIVAMTSLPPVAVGCIASISAIGLGYTHHGFFKLKPPTHQDQPQPENVEEAHGVNLEGNVI